MEMKMEICACLVDCLAFGSLHAWFYKVLAHMLSIFIARYEHSFVHLSMVLAVQDVPLV